jgi:hypothetical protein
MPARAALTREVDRGPQFGGEARKRGGRPAPWICARFSGGWQGLRSMHDLRAIGVGSTVAIVQRGWDSKT